MRLIPVPVLIEQADLDTVQPWIEQRAAEFKATAPDTTRLTMRLNGWTAEMIAWSQMLHGIAASIRAGDIAFEVQVNPAPGPDKAFPDEAIGTVP